MDKTQMNNTNSDNITVAGTDFFADSESFLNELTDSETVQTKGASVGSQISLLLCDDQL